MPIQFTTNVTQKGQITLPKSLREKLSIEPYDKVVVKKAGNHLKIYPTQDILDIAGKYQAKKGQSALKARELMERNYKRV